MAISAVPFALQNVPINADVVREAVSSLISNAGGVVQPGDFAVAQTGTPSMAVTVGVGRAWIRGTEVTNLAGQTYSKQGQYFVMNDASVTLTINPADNTNPRIDVVYIAIQDATYSGTNNTAVLAVMQGAATPTPAVPSLPNNAIALAQVAVGANVTSILTANITTVASALTKHAEWTTSAGGLAINTVYNFGTATAVAAATTDPNFYTFSGGGIVCAQPGAYIVTYSAKWSTAIPSGVRAFVQLSSSPLGAGTLYARNDWGPAEDSCSTSACMWIPAGGAVYPSEYQNQGTLNLTGYLTIQKVG